MKDINRLTPVALRTPRTRRNHELSVLTSLQSGKSVPVAAVPMLREESMVCRATISVEMEETREILMNGVDLRVSAYFVPFLAFERFDGSRDQFDRSYAGQPKVDGGTVTPFFETGPSGPNGDNAIHKYLGLHFKAGDTQNFAYIEAYNAIYNMRATNRSKGIVKRNRLDNATLAPAFWNHSQFGDIVPDFDQAVIDGEVTLNMLQTRYPVKGIGIHWPGATASYVAKDTAGVDGTRTGWLADGVSTTPTAGQTRLFIEGNLAAGPQIFTEMAGNGITVSLANIEMARKTQAFAKLRQAYEGIADEYLIDMLMDGLTIPDQALKQPVLLASQMTRFAQAKRYATDSGNLADSAVSGGAVLNIAARVPRQTTGGIVMFIAEAVPQQLFERQRDWLAYTTTTSQLPEFLRDELDPEKVDVVLNGQIDVLHATQNGVFGYEPMNAKFNRAGARIGGKFHRPVANAATDSDRQQFWAVETINPVLAESFYVVKDIHNKVFLNSGVDPFRATVAGNAVMEGNTVFGGLLVEATNNYDKVAAAAPTPAQQVVKP